jgi:osmotically inducible lipoprotein OsmB
MTVQLLPIATLLAAVSLAACGTNTEQRAATGAVTGAVIAGPVGAVVGAGAGVVAERIDRAN